MVLVIRTLNRSHAKEVSFLRDQNTDLLNRLQSGDFKTYAALRNVEGEFPVTKPMTDYEELRRLNAAQGLGEPEYDPTSEPDDEFSDAFTELSH
jgi:hypothetical protein